MLGSKPKIFVTRPDIPPEAIEILQEECDVEMFEEERTMTKEELVEAIEGKNGIFCVLNDLLDRDVIEAGKDLKVIATMSSSAVHIDLQECKNREIKVGNLPPEMTADAVAEWAVLMMLAAGRNFMEAATATKEGQWVEVWKPMWLCGRGLKDAVVGIIGMGRISQGIVERIKPFGVKQVLYFDVMHPIEPAEDLGAVFADFEELLKNSDFIVSMSNATDETKNILNKKAFDMMKKECCFISCSSPSVVDQTDLFDALKNKTIRCAALDVQDPEPFPKDHELLSLSNIIITPHVGSAETKTRIDMAMMTAENILAGVMGEELKNPVSMPD